MDTYTHAPRERGGYSPVVSAGETYAVRPAARPRPAWATRHTHTRSEDGACVPATCANGKDLSNLMLAPL